MPAEYTNCVKSSMKRGVPAKEAKARCAGAYYKRHKMTVNEAHKKGIAFDLDEEETEMVGWIMSGGKVHAFVPPPSGDLDPKGKTILAKVYSGCRRKWVDAHPDDPENKENKASCAKQAWTAVQNASFKPSGGAMEASEWSAESDEAKTPSLYIEGAAPASDAESIHILGGKSGPFGEDDLLTGVAARTGSSAYIHEPTGPRRVRWRKEALARAARSWVGKRVDANHEDADDGVILTSRMDGENLVQTFAVSDALRAAIERNWPHVGLSVEASVKTEGDEITDGVGTGVAVVLYPKFPACTQKEGCKVMGEEMGDEPEKPDCAKELEAALIKEKEDRAVVDEKLKSQDTELAELRAFRTDIEMKRRSALLKAAEDLGAHVSLQVMATLPLDVLDKTVEGMKEVAAKNEPAKGSGAQAADEIKGKEKDDEPKSALTDDKEYERILRAEAAANGLDPDKYVKENLRGAK